MHTLCVVDGRNHCVYIYSQIQNLVINHLDFNITEHHDTDLQYTMAFFYAFYVFHVTLIQYYLQHFKMVIYTNAYSNKIKYLI